MTRERLEEDFGADVASLVWDLTDQAPMEMGNRETRKAWERERVAKASSRAQTIKLADLISNSKSIVKYDPGFAHTYLREKRLLLDCLSNGDRKLWREAMRHCMSGFETLGMEP